MHDVIKPLEKNRDLSTINSEFKNFKFKDDRVEVLGLVSIKLPDCLQWRSSDIGSENKRGVLFEANYGEKSDHVYIKIIDITNDEHPQWEKIVIENINNEDLNKINDYLEGQALANDLFNELHLLSDGIKDGDEHPVEWPAEVIEWGGTTLTEGGPGEYQVLCSTYILENKRGKQRIIVARIKIRKFFLIIESGFDLSLDSELSKPFLNFLNNIEMKCHDNWCDPSIPELLDAWKLYFQSLNEMKVNILLELSLKTEHSAPSKDKFIDQIIDIKDDKYLFDAFIDKLKVFSDEDTKDAMKSISEAAEATSGGTLLPHFESLPIKSIKIITEYLHQCSQVARNTFDENVLTDLRKNEMHDLLIHICLDTLQKKGIGCINLEEIIRFKHEELLNLSKEEIINLGKEKLINFSNDEIANLRKEELINLFAEKLYKTKARDTWLPTLRELEYWDRLNIRVGAFSFSKPMLQDATKMLDNFSEDFAKSWLDSNNKLFFSDSEEEMSQTYAEWSEYILGDWKSHMPRYRKLFPPFVKEGVVIPSKIKDSYAETRRTYVYGQFKSSVALSRAVIEVALKEKVGLSKYDPSWTAGKTLTQFLDKKIINKITYDTADDIIVRADAILHRGAGITEEECIYLLNKTKDFIEAIYS